MMKDALKNKVKSALKIEISIKPGDGSVDGMSPEASQISQADAEMKSKEDELQKSSDLAPIVKDSDEPGVITTDADTENKEAQMDEGMIQQMPRPAPMDQNSLNARARRKMMEEMAAKKGLKV